MAPPSSQHFCERYVTDHRRVVARHQVARTINSQAGTVSGVFLSAAEAHAKGQPMRGSHRSVLITMVTGPSFTNRTAIWAPKEPV